MWGDGCVGSGLVNDVVGVGGVVVCWGGGCGVV